jgi:hypothetical protein
MSAELKTGVHDKGVDGVRALSTVKSLKCLATSGSKRKRTIG